MVEPLTVGFHAIERGRVIDSDVVMVLGCGMIGSGAIASAAQRGATVIAAEKGAVTNHNHSLLSPTPFLLNLPANR